MPLTKKQLEVISPGGEIEFFELNSNGVTYIGRHSDNQIVIDDPEIALFQAILDHRQKPCYLTQTSQTGLMSLEGMALDPNIPRPIHPGNSGQLAGYTFIFIEDDSQWLEDIVDLELLPGRYGLVPGQTVAGRLTIRNKSRYSTQFTITVETIPPEWVTISWSQIVLKRGEQAIIPVTIAPPRSSAGRAGLYDLVIVATSPDYPGQAGRCKATLRIDPYYEFAITELSPKRQLLSRFQRSASLTVSLINKSNCDLPLQLTGIDQNALDERKKASSASQKKRCCLFEFQPPDEAVSLASEIELDLSPGEKVSVRTDIIIPPPPLIALNKHAYFLVITAASQHRKRSILGRLERPPLIGPWLVSFMAFWVVALMVFSGPRLIEYFWIETEETDRPLIVEELRSPTPEPVIKPNNILPTSEVRPEIQKAITYEEMFREIAPQYDLDWRLLAAVAYHESRLNPVAMGRDGEMGMMQIMPYTWNKWSLKAGVTDPFDPYGNVLVGASYLDYVRSYCTAQGYTDDYWMLVGYNWGIDNLDQLFDDEDGSIAVPQKTQQYALNILKTTPHISTAWPETIDESFVSLTRQQIMNLKQ